MSDHPDEIEQLRAGFDRAVELLKDGLAKAVAVVAMQNGGMSLRFWGAGNPEEQDKLAHVLFGIAYEARTKKDEEPES